MLPISLLQSQLAHNKKRINELQAKVRLYKSNRGYVLLTLEEPHGLSEDEETECKNSVIQYCKKLKSTRKQLKQLAVLQKSIKFEINQQSYWIANLVKQAMKNIQGD